MRKPMTLNVRVSGVLGEFVTANVGSVGTYENVSEYVRDLIRRDKERVETERLDFFVPNCRQRSLRPNPHIERSTSIP